MATATTTNSYSSLDVFFSSAQSPRSIKLKLTMGVYYIYMMYLTDQIQTCCAPTAHRGIRQIKTGRYGNEGKLKIFTYFRCRQTNLCQIDFMKSFSNMCMHVVMDRITKKGIRYICRSASVRKCNILHPTVPFFVFRHFVAILSLPLFFVAIQKWYFQAQLPRRNDAS